MRESRPIIALDFPDQEAVENFLDKFPKDEQLFVKVGMELFYAAGPNIISMLKAHGHNVFLDLKLHDIPHTVHQAMKVLAKLGVDITNVHAAGGSTMMQAAVEGLQEGASGVVPKLLAVTQLTSTSQVQMNKEQGIPGDLLESVLRYAKCAHQAHLQGVVCSALEAAAIHQATSDEFLCLTPGIRPQNAAVGDQKRVVTPAKAYELTSNYIVVGRPITQALNPFEAYTAITEQWNGAK